MKEQYKKCEKCGASTECVCEPEGGQDYIDVYKLICPNHGEIDKHVERDYKGEWTNCPFCGESSETHKTFIQPKQVHKPNA